MPGYMKSPMDMMGMRDKNLMKRKLMMTAKIGKELKEVPAGKDGAGLRALPKSVRNKMGYAARGYEKKYQGGGAPGDGKPKKKGQYGYGGTPTMYKGKKVPGMFDM